MLEEAELEPCRKHRRLARHEGYLAGENRLEFCMYGGYARDVGQHINELASIPKVPRQILIYTEEQGGMGKGKLYPGGKKSPDNQR